MRFSNFTIIVAALTCGSCASSLDRSRILQPIAADDASYVTVCFGDFGGVHYNFETTPAVLRSTPGWLPTEEFPPLSPRNAKEAAYRKVQEIRPDVRRWKLMAISLEEEPTVGAWFYRVSFSRADVDNTGGLIPRLDIPVLMDGTAMEARKAVENR